jgi:SOS-response transcriptional repressor LexA
MSDCSTLEPYALRVIGDSMAPEFWDGCIIIVDPAYPPGDGAYVVVDYAGETVFRQLAHEQGRRVLRALNGGYPAIELAGPYTVRGVVVQRAGTRRADRKHYV